MASESINAPVCGLRVYLSWTIYLLTYLPIKNSLIKFHVDSLGCGIINVHADKFVSALANHNSDRKAYL